MMPVCVCVASIAMSLFLETSGFATGVYRYVRSQLVDWKTVSALTMVPVPLGVVGALAARSAPVPGDRGPLPRLRRVTQEAMGPADGRNPDTGRLEWPSSGLIRGRVGT